MTVQLELANKDSDLNQTDQVHEHFTKKHLKLFIPVGGAQSFGNSSNI